MPDDLSLLQQRLLARVRDQQLFAVVSWGCAATKWIAKVLNTHPEILCLHHCINAVACFHSTMNSLQYLRALSLLGDGYKAVGDVHGVPRTEISNLREVFGGRFSAVIVVREPIARLRSQMALSEEFRGLGAWDFSYVDKLAESKGIVAKSEEAKMFVHAANMLNAITEEVSLGTLYKSEDLTSNPESLAALVTEITAGQIEPTPQSLTSCLATGKLNVHHTKKDFILSDWEREVLRAIVLPEAWAIYQELGYRRRSPYFGSLRLVRTDLDEDSSSSLVW